MPPPCSSRSGPRGKPCNPAWQALQPLRSTGEHGGSARCGGSLGSACGSNAFPEECCAWEGGAGAAVQLQGGEAALPAGGALCLPTHMPSHMCVVPPCGLTEEEDQLKRDSGGTRNKEGATRECSKNKLGISPLCQ